MNPIESWHEEKQSAWLYRALADAESEARMSVLFGQLGTAAEQQAEHWAGLIADKGAALPDFVPETRVRLVATLARQLGPRRIKPVLAAMKVRGLSAYG